MVFGRGVALYEILFVLFLKAGVAVGWLLAVGVCLGAVLVKYDENHVLLEESFYWSRATRSAHEALYRPFFAFAVCAIILLCATGHGGAVSCPV